MRVYKESLWFIIFFVFLSYFSFSIIEYSQEQKSLFQLSNSLYSANAITINSDDEISLAEAMESVGGDLRLFLECNENFRFFLQSGQWSPTMQEGDFFSSDQLGDRAVIGKGMVDLMKEKDQKQYIDFQNKQYEVIGIMGASFSTSTDYLVLLQPDSRSNVKGTDFIMDGDIEKRVQEGAGQLCTDFSEVVASKRDAIGIARISDTLFFSNLLNLCATLLLVFGFMAFFRLWYEKKRSELCLLVLLGISGVEIIFTQVTKVFVHMATALLISDSLIIASADSVSEVKFIAFLNGGFLLTGVLLTFFHIKKELKFE